MFAIAKRVGLFLLLNFLVIMSMSIVMRIFGIGSYIEEYGLNYTSLAVFALVYGMVGSLVSLAMSKQMAKWSYGVQIIDPNTGDHQLRALVQIVHSLSKRVGIDKMPEVGIYQSDDINAFATGMTKNSSLVAVSTGLLNHMDADEVEAVLGHEISHVANGDMVTMTLLQGVVNAFCIFLARAIAYAVTMGRNSESNNNGGGSLVYWLVSMLLQTVFMLFGSMLVAAFSRYREYRADHGGATLAGKEKMVHALEKLRAQFDRIEPVRGNASALMISNKPTGLIEMLFSTHPPLEKRIEKLRSSK